MGATIRRLELDEIEAYVELRRAMLRDSPLAFAASEHQDSGCNVEVLRKRLDQGPNNVIFGAFAGEIVGAIGIVRHDAAKAAHRAFLWGMYVSPRLRRQGLGRRLVERALAHARTLEGVVQVHLSVTDPMGAARALYESCGFTLWGTEPRALGHEGEYVAEHHLVLALDDVSGREPPATGRRRR
jgi:ribosomal protein S18 acetylase RimI-like enzyme